MPFQVDEKAPPTPEEKIALLTSNGYIEQLIAKRDQLIEAFTGNFKSLDTPNMSDQPVTENLKEVLKILVVTFDIYCLESMSILKLYKEASDPSCTNGVNFCSIQNPVKKRQQLEAIQRQLALHKAEHERIGDEFEFRLNELTEIIRSAVPEASQSLETSNNNSSTREAGKGGGAYRSLTLQKIESHLKQRKCYYESFIKIL